MPVPEFLPNFNTTVLEFLLQMETLKVCMSPTDPVWIPPPSPGVHPRTKFLECPLPAIFVNKPSKLRELKTGLVVLL